MIISQVQKDGEDYFVEIPEVDMKRLGLHEGDIVKSTFHKILNSDPVKESEAGDKPQQNTDRSETKG